MSKRSDALVALGVTLAIQVFTSLAATAAAVLAPEIGPRSRHQPDADRRLRRLALRRRRCSPSLASAGSSSAMAPIRVSQACRAGLRGRHRAGRRSRPWALLIAPALVIGVGYGPITAASSQLLARTAPPQHDGAHVLDQADRGAARRGARRRGAASDRAGTTAGARRSWAAAIAGVVIALCRAADSRVALDAGQDAASIGVSLERLFVAAAGWSLAVARSWSSRGSDSSTRRRRSALLSFLVVYLTAKLDRRWWAPASRSRWRRWGAWSDGWAGA